MRSKIVPVIMLLVLLVGLMGGAPAASQEPSLTATPLEAESSFETSKQEGVQITTSDDDEEGGGGLVSVIVKLEDDPLASYTGDIPGLAATSPTVTGAEKLDVGSPESQDYLGYLAAQQEKFISVTKESIDAQITYRYDVIIGGVAMVLPENQLGLLAKQPGVEAIYLDELAVIDTDTSPKFVGATKFWKELGGVENAGEGVVVGVLDTGIWPEHPSFSDPDPAGKPYPAPPASWTGTTCEFGSAIPGDAPFTCNNKLIGAQRFMATYQANQTLLAGEFLSARDDNGHGTHTASTAAGNYGVEAVMLGAPRGKVSGIAPRAHVVMYKVCGDAGCYHTDSAAAIQQAIIDGVDVLNFSIGGGANPYSEAPDVAFLNAYAAGVFVACSAGNSGPGPDTVGHRGPWVTTVAASTHSRTFEASVTLVADNSDTLTLDGASITGGYTGDVVLAADYGDALCLSPFAPGTFSGQIVVCERGIIARVTKSFNVAEGGAGGMILYNPVLQGLSTDPHYVPSIHIENDAGAALLTFLAGHTGVVGTLSGGIKVKGQGDVMAAFSSRGGPGQTLGVSKPDITAPGVQILAGNTPLGATQGPGGMGPYGELFQAIGGTSMSSPHVAGAAALLMDLHPGWTPGQVKSALMTSAKAYQLVKEDGVTPFDPFDAGSGRLKLHGAAYTGLTFDVPAADYVTHADDLWNVNYPSLYVPVMPGKITVQRTAHSELGEAARWKMWVERTADLKVTVPRYLDLPAGGDTTFDITVDARNVPLGEVRHAVIHMRSGKYIARFPITIVRREPVVTLSKHCEPDVFPRGSTTECTITVENTSFDDATVSVADQLPRQLELVSGSVVGGVEAGNGVTFDGTLLGAAPPLVTVVDGTGTTPAGYLPLSLFGIAPIGGVTDEMIVNFSVTPFVYAGETYDRIGMVSNGYAVVGGGDSADINYINQVLPNPARPNNVLAPFWTDLNPAAGGALRAAYLSGGGFTWLVLDWENVPEYGDGTPGSFQIWVGVGSGVEDISFTYGPVGDGDGGWLTVGAENAFGNSGSNWYVDGSGTPVVAGDELRVVSVPGAPGETHVITFTALGKKKGLWQNCAEMTGDIFYGTNIACFNGQVLE